MLRRPAHLGHRVLVRVEQTSRGVDVGGRDHAEEVLKDVEGCNGGGDLIVNLPGGRSEGTSATYEHRSSRCKCMLDQLETSRHGGAEHYSRRSVERLRDAREVRSERELVDDVAQIHHCPRG